MYQVSSEIWPERSGLVLVERENMKGRGFEKIGNEKIEIDGGRGSGVTCFIKDIDYNGVATWKGKRKIKKKEKNRQ